MSTILFYAPFNQRSRDTESLMIAFHKQSHHVICLSQQEGYQINDFLNAHGVSAYSYVLHGKRSGWWYYFRHLLFFIRFCWKHEVDIVYSHLEPANFVTSIGQYFIRGDAYLCRHHIDEGMLYKFDQDSYYRITYHFARKIIVVSNQARKYMVEREGIKSSKILHVNLAYDFKLYNKPDNGRVASIRNQYHAEVLLLSVCRLTTYKRPELAIRVVEKLLGRGLDVKLVLLGVGEMQEQLRDLIDKLNLGTKVAMPGYVSNVMEFMTASVFLIHPSLLDSSCVTIKEAGLAKLPVIVCRGVGDFDDYLRHEENGFLVDRDKFVEAASEVIQQNFRNKEKLKKTGAALHDSVIQQFSIENVIHQYDFLNKAK